MLANRILGGWPLLVLRTRLGHRCQKVDALFFVFAQTQPVVGLPLHILCLTHPYRIMTKNWEPLHEEIRRLYHSDGKPLAEVMRLVQGKHGFIAS